MKEFGTERIPAPRSELRRPMTVGKSPTVRTGFGCTSENSLVSISEADISDDLDGPVDGRLIEEAGESPSTFSGSNNDSLAVSFLDIVL